RSRNTCQDVDQWQAYCGRKQRTPHPNRATRTRGESDPGRDRGSPKVDSVKKFALIVIIFAASLSAAPSPTFHLFFIGHEIGSETDTWVSRNSGSELEAVFHFLDRSTSVDLTGTLELANDGSPRHLAVKGRNYRLFSSDTEVTIADGRALTRD